MAARSVRTEEEEGRFAREGELPVRVFRRARTPCGAVSRMDVDGLERLSLRPSCAACGLKVKEPLIT